MKAIIGIVLREYRIKAGLSQDDLVNETDLSKSFLSNLENGKKEPSLITIFRIASGLHCKAWEIVNSIEERIEKKKIQELENSKSSEIDLTHCIVQPDYYFHKKEDINRSKLITRIKTHLEDVDYIDLDYYKYDPDFGDWDLDADTYVKADEVELPPDLEYEIDLSFNDVLSENSILVSDSDYMTYLMRKYYYLDKEQRTMIVQRNVVHAESLLDTLYKIFSFRGNNSEKEILIRYFLRKMEDDYTCNFIKACDYLAYAADIPVIINKIKEKGTSFTYNETDGFLYNKKLLHLLDYENLLKRFLLNEKEENTQVLDREPIFDKLDKFLTHRESDGKYQIKGKIITFLKALAKETTNMKPDYMEIYLLKSNGKPLGKKYVEQKWREECKYELDKKRN